MFTFRQIKETDDRGSLMLEAIALLGLMTMMSPMVVRQTADRTAEMEEVTIAAQIKDLKEAIHNYISANYRSIAQAANTSTGLNRIDYKKDLSAEHLAPYLPSGLLNSSKGFRGNKLIETFKVGVRAQCTEVSNKNGSDCEKGTCYTLNDDGVVSDTISAENQDCSRYRMTGLVISDGDAEIDDRRATRIASMIGADGGYLPTASRAALETNVDMAKKTILGTQGIWESDVTKFLTNLNQSIGGRVAATTVYTSGSEGDFLYRKRVNGLPDANSMFTNLDMGGNNPNCNAESGCHNINNAGGLEVVGGQIIIRSANLNDTNFHSDKDHIYLNTSKAFINVGDVNFTGTATAKITGNTGELSMGSTSATLKHTSSMLNLSGTAALLNASGTVLLNVGNTAGMKIESTAITLNRNNAVLDIRDSGIKLDTNTVENSASKLNMTSTQVDLTVNESNSLLLNATDAQLKTSKSSLDLNNSGAYLNGNGGALTLTSAKAQLKSGSGTFTLNSVQMSTSVSNALFSLDGGQGILNVGSGSSFLLNSSVFSVSTDNNKARMILTNSGLSVIQNAAPPRILLNNGTNDLISISAYANTDTGYQMRIAGTVADESSTPIVFYVNSGRIGASFFQPENKIMGNSGSLVDTVQSRAKITTNYDTGQTSVGSYTTSGIGGNAAVIINYSATDNVAPYRAHWDTSDSQKDRDGRYNRFRVDPAYISVMNDIKLTSRGGARLSELLPNYILKGIYILTNTYASGGGSNHSWPCDNNNNKNNSCTFIMPYYNAASLGLGSGGDEFNCGDATHPIRIGGGYCNVTTNNNVTYVTFSYINMSNEYYTYCADDTFCWAHPFMGIVPAPGRSISVNEKLAGASQAQSSALHAEEEGVCPDGYQAIMTLTPNSFEMGRVIAYNPDAIVGDAIIKYNFDYLDFTEGYYQKAANMFQAATRMGVVVDAVKDDNNAIKGWKVAMGTITPTLAGGKEYIWNLGGVATGSWTVIAHTYCYFNPERFTMPNMIFRKLENGKFTTGTSSTGSNVIMTPMDNPLIGTNYMN